MNPWLKLRSDINNAIGEVASIEGDIIEIFVYPEKFHRIKVGEIVYIYSREVEPLGVVLKLMHSSRYRAFTPMKQDREEILKAYPDLQNYHRFVSSVVYTSHLVRDAVKHYRSSMPLLHDLVFVLDSFDLLEKFFKPDGRWDFSFLTYFIRAGADVIDIKEFLMRHLDFLKHFENEKDEIITSLTRVLSMFDFNDFYAIFEFVEEIL